jgi:hypothetical protein
MKITLNRFLVFISIVLVAALAMQQCWQRKSEAEKWLYIFGEPAREYAGRVLGPDRGRGLPPPESLSEMSIDVHAQEEYVVYSSDMFAVADRPELHMAFSPGGPPPVPADRPGRWTRVRDSWYWLRPAP